MHGVQEGLTEADGDLKKAEELLRIKSGAKASKAASRVAAEGVIGASVSSDGSWGAGRAELRDRLRGEERGFRRFRQALAELSQPQTETRRSVALSRRRKSRRSARRWCRRSART
jgi:elongation factor Ts